MKNVYFIHDKRNFGLFFSPHSFYFLDFCHFFGRATISPKFKYKRTFEGFNNIKKGSFLFLFLHTLLWGFYCFYLSQQSLTVFEKQNWVHMKAKVDQIQEFDLQDVDFFIGDTSNSRIVVIIIEPVVKKFRCEHDSGNQQSNGKN